MKRKVVLLVETLENESVLLRRDIEDIRDKGYALEVWNLERICYPDSVAVNQISCSDVNIYCFGTKLACYNLLKENREAIFLDFLGETSLPKLWVRTMLGRMKCDFYMFFEDQVPNMANVSDREEMRRHKDKNDHIPLIKSTRKKIKSVRDKIKKKGFFKWFFCAFYERPYGMVLKFSAEKNPPHAIFMATHLNYANLPDEYRNVSVRYLHAWNYEKYIRTISGKENFHTGNFIVYVDQGFANHPDFKRKGMIIFEDVDEIDDYYNKMKHFFDVIEEYYHLPVKVAGHPCAFYKGDEFGNRDIIAGQTAELVSSADLVIICYSTAVSFAALYKKPIMLINNKYLKKIHYIQNNIMAFQICFKTESVYVEEIDNVKIDDYVLKDMRVMEKYVHNYVKEEISVNKPYWDIVFGFIQFGEGRKPNQGQTDIC